ncbi:MAG: hypothetical protein SFX18_12100 [Pirellulales bacterium]|nr:hypothetical protein [Pirellulales bacterium]
MALCVGLAVVLCHSPPPGGAGEVLGPGHAGPVSYPVHLVQPSINPNQLTPPGLRPVPDTKFPEITSGPAGSANSSSSATNGNLSTTEGQTPPLPGTSVLSGTSLENQQQAFALNTAANSARATNWLNEAEAAHQLAPPRVDTVWMPANCQCADPDFCPKPPPHCLPFSVEAGGIVLERNRTTIPENFPTIFGATLASVDRLDEELVPRFRLVTYGPNGYDVEGIYFGTRAWHEQALVTWNGVTAPLLFDAQFHNGELNLLRHANDWLTWLVGARYMEFGEELGFRTAVAGAPIVFQWESYNYLIGAQVGAKALLFNWQDRLELEAMGKIGLFHNDSHTEQVVVTTGTITSRFRNELQQEVGMGEVSLIGTWRIYPQFAIRGGYQYIWIDDISQAFEGGLDGQGLTNMRIFGGMLGAEVRW